MTTSERDFFYAANMNFIARLREHSVPVDSLIYDWDTSNTEHTWQQDFRYPESQEVYRRLHAFVRKWPEARTPPGPPGRSRTGLCLVHGVCRQQRTERPGTRGVRIGAG